MMISIYSALNWIKYDDKAIMKEINKNGMRNINIDKM